MSLRKVEISLSSGCISVSLKEGKRKPFKDSHAGVNTSNKVMVKQLRANLRLQLPQLRINDTREEELCILAGGPSMLDSVGEIKEQVANGAKTMVLNGAHDWAGSVGITRHFYAMLDQREWSARFVASPHKGITYLISSSCHPKVFENLRGCRVYLYHCAGSKARMRVVSNFYQNVTLPWVEGGTTIGLRSLMLARFLGFNKLHLYGMDACVIDTKHHAYVQQENDNATLEIVGVGEREFLCQGWMVDQAVNFLDLIKARGDLFQVQVHGDGLIAHLVKYIAERGQALASIDAQDMTAERREELKKLLDDSDTATAISLPRML